MCDLVTGIAAASAGIKIFGAVADHKAQNDAYAANREATLDALKIKNHELSLREVEERIAGAQQIEQGGLQVLDAKGDASASAASRGVKGLSIDLLLQDLDRQGVVYAGSVDQNTNAAVAQLDREKDAALAEARGRINSQSKANPWATGLKIGSAGLEFASTKIGNKPKGT